MNGANSLHICPHCGSTHSLGARFCPFTGKSLVPRWTRWWVWGMVVALLVVIGRLIWWLVSVRDALPLAESSTLTSSPITAVKVVVDKPVSTHMPVPTKQPTYTPTPSNTPTLTATSQPTVTPTPFVTRVIETDGAALVFVPAGEFLMGSDHGTDPYF